MAGASDDLLSLDPAHPRFTATLHGQTEASETLRQSWLSQRMPHAWLLAGPPGIGKATLAYRFARFLLKHGKQPPAGLFGGEAPTNLALDPADPIFRRVATMGHGDLVTIERTPNLKTGKMRKEIAVEEVRRLPEFFSKTAAEDGYRIAIVDSADELNRHSANALLKIVEEPPSHAIILIVAHAAGAVLPTIRSRCRRLDLRPLADRELEAFLAERLPDLEAEEKALLLRLAEGSPGRAMRLASLEATALFQDLIKLLEALPNIPVAELHRFADQLSRRAADGGYQVGLELVSWWLARLIRTAASGIAAGGDILPGESRLIERLAGRANAERWLSVREHVGRLAERGETLNLDRKQVVLSAFSAIAQAARGSHP